jgi:dihydrolipoamide dehydrogenase
VADCSVAIVGAGPGGYVAALRAAGLGAKVVLIESTALGGTCLNVGCIPSKAYLHLAELYETLRRDGARFGITAERLGLDFAKVVDHKDRVVKLNAGGLADLLRKRGVEVVKGRGRLDGPKKLSITGPDGTSRSLTAVNVIVATGSVPVRFDFIPFDGRRVFTSDDVWDLRELPEHALIVGGGVIGCEFASIFGGFGAQVTVVEMLDRILPLQDEDVSAELTKAFRKRKVRLRTGCKVEQMTVDGAAVRSTLDDGTQITSDLALVAVGRRPRTEDLGLEEAGVKMDDGRIVVDEHCRTNVAGIYAIGDCAATLQLAHVASRMGVVAAENACDHEATETLAVVPAGIFTHPQVGEVGLTEAEARKQGRDVKVARFPMMASGVAHAYGATEGFAKLVADPATGEILGASIVGAHAAEIIHEIAMAMRNELTVDEIALTIHAHPTISETVHEAAETWLDRAIHGL